MSKKSLYCLVLVLFLALLPCIYAADEYKPYLHKPSVPEHPKVKMYGSYQTNLFPGAATYSYSIEVPKGTNDLQPSLSLTYNSQSVKQRAGVVGAGWTITENYMYRDANSTLSNTSDDFFTLVLNSNAYKLVYDANDALFHTNPETYLRIQNYSSYWVVTGKDGTQYRFGYNADSRLNSSYGYDVKWSLDLVTDSHGNKIYYAYQENSYSGDFGAVYLANISYNNDQKRSISFSYEARPDTREVYEQGIRANVTRRLSAVSVYANSLLVRKYALSYNPLNTANTIAPVASIVYYGADGISLLHNISFDYYSSEAGYYKNTTRWKPPVLFSDDTHADFGVRLADLNRDGFIDVLQSRQGTSEKHAWLNDRNNNWTSSTSFVPPEYFENGGSDTAVRLVDFDRDGYTDILQNYEGTAVKAWRNNGTGFADVSSLWAPPASIYFIDSYGRDPWVQFEDLNGDGYTDMIRSFHDDSDLKKTYLNNKTGGWILAEAWNAPVVFTIDYADSGARLVDVNGDGLVDIVQSSNVNGPLKRAWLNTGSGWVPANSTWNVPVYFTESGRPDKGIRFMDVNNDGLVDLVEDYANQSETPLRSAYLNTGHGWSQSAAWQSPEAFTKDGYNIGRRIGDVNGDGFGDVLVAHNSVDYQYSWVKNATTPYLLKAITNEYGGVTLLNYTDSTQYNNTGNDSLSDIGFNVNVVKSVTQNNSIQVPFGVFSLSNYTYYGGKYDYSSSEFRGFAIVNETKADNTKAVHYFLQDDALKGREYKTEIYDANNIIYSKEQNTYRSVLNNSYYKIYLDMTSSTEYDNNAKAKEVNTSYEYNSYGDVSRKFYQGDTSITGDEKSEEYVYWYNTTNWIMGKVRRYLLQDNSTIAKVSWYSYDNGVNQAPQSKGDLTRVENWLSGSSNPITSYEYDNYGNLIRETDALGHVTRHEYGTRDTTYTYKDRDVNALGYFTDYSTDLGTGNLIWKEENHIRKSYYYDAFGRAVKEVMPYDDVQMPTTSYNYSFDGIAPEIIKVSKKAAANSTIDTYSYYDGFANLVQQRSSAESGQQAVKDIFYNELFNAKAESIPYFDVFNTNISTQNNPTTNYTYDALGRVVRVTNPDGTNKTITFTSNNVTAFDENSHKKKYLLDSFGRIQNVFEYNNEPVLNDNNEHIYNTTYSYDLNDNLIKIIDAKGNNFIFTFDTLGRKVGMNDPDLGIWSYSYDANGNLLKQSDANGNSINESYDALNRLIRKAVNNSVITFAYDGQYFGLIDNMTFDHELYASAIYKFTYDQRYRIISEVMIVNGSEVDTGNTYDSMDRLIEERAGGFGDVDYIYDERGLIDKIPNFVNGTAYNAFGNPLNRSFTNSKTMQYAYNSQNGRLTGIDTTSIQNLDYTYDNVGNVKQINDVVNNRVQGMTYDYLDRLVNANINNSNYRYVYDETGNILKIIKDFNSSTRFGHTSSHVHAPSSVVDGNAGVMAYKINQLNDKDKNRTVEFYLVNEKNETLNNVNWTIDWGDSSSTGSTISINLSFGQNIMVIAGHTYANAGDFNISVRASYANNTDIADEKAVKFGIKADSLSLLNQNITNTTFEFKVRNDMAENANAINWSCDDGISSVTPFNLTGNQSIFIIIASNYSTPGGKALVCNATSANGNDLKSLSFNIKDVAIEEYNSTIITGSKRLVNLMVKNYFSTQNVGYTFQSDGQIYSGTANIGSGNTSLISQQINYSTPGTKTLIANISTAYTIDNRTESIVLKGLEISNYLLVNKTLTDKILGYTILNQWDNMSVNWTLTNPLVSSGTKVNLSFNETLFVLIEENYTTSSTKDVNFTIFNGTISASFIDRFIVNIVEILSNQMLYGSSTLSISEIVARSNIGSLNISWRFNTGQENITSNTPIALNNSAPAFIFIANNYTASGVYTTEAYINSTLYNNTLSGAVIAK